MYYLIYKVTNIVNNKIYIGSHKTKIINDGYMGSGKYLKYAINKYGLENFKKEILFVYDNPAEMFAKEAEIVNEDFLAEENTYNLKKGGFGGFDYINAAGLNNTNATGKGGQTTAKKWKNEADIDWAKKERKSRSDRIKKEYASGKRKPVFTTEFNAIQSAKAQSESAKIKRKETRELIQFQKGTNNSQFGTTWIWHELIGNKKIKKELLPEYIEQGWLKKYIPGYRV